MLCTQFQRIAELGAKSPDSYELVIKILVELKEKMLKGKLSCSEDQLNEKEQSKWKNEETDKQEKKKHVEEGSCS